MHRHPVVFAVALLLMGAAPAAAQETTPEAPAPESTQVTATMRLILERVNGAQQAVISGSRIRVRGMVSRYVPGQTVTIRWYRGTRKVGVRTVAIQPAGSSVAGRFTAGIRVTGDRKLLIKASHRATPELATMVAAPKRLRVVARSVEPGERGLAVRLLQAQLKRRGYVIGQPGVFDGRTARAVAAFRKLTGMARTERADRAVFDKLAAGAGYFKVRYPKHGHHAEGDLTHQVLALIDNGKVQRIYPLSSGKPSTPTILGTFRVYSKTPGTNAKGMVFSNYFIRGYAIHGYAEVPPYPASHGCLRVPVPDAVPIYNWLRYGDIVDTYYR